MKEEFDFLSISGRDTAFIPLNAGDVVFAKGEPSRAMYVVRWGSLEILDGTVVLETVGQGGVVGEMAMVDGGPRSATVRAIVDAQIIPIDRPNFVKMVEEIPAFALQVMKVMARRLRATNERLQRAARKRPVKARARKSGKARAKPRRKIKKRMRTR